MEAVIALLVWIGVLFLGVLLGVVGVIALLWFGDRMPTAFRDRTREAALYTELILRGEVQMSSLKARVLTRAASQLDSGWRGITQDAARISRLYESGLPMQPEIANKIRAYAEQLHGDSARFLATLKDEL